MSITVNMILELQHEKEEVVKQIVDIATEIEKLSRDYLEKTHQVAAKKEKITKLESEKVGLEQRIVELEQAIAGYDERLSDLQEEQKHKLENVVTIEEKLLWQKLYDIFENAALFAKEMRVHSSTDQSKLWMISKKWLVKVENDEIVELKIKDSKGFVHFWLKESGWLKIGPWIDVFYREMSNLHSEIDFRKSSSTTNMSLSEYNNTVSRLDGLKF